MPFRLFHNEVEPRLLGATESGRKQFLKIESTIQAEYATIPFEQWCDMSILDEGDTIRDTYEVERFLGEGAFAEVYRVKHKFFGRQAMKVFKTPSINADDVTKMLQEAILLSRIGHPNIVRVFDANTIETKRGTCGFFTMEYVPGGTLDKLRRSYGTKRMPVETCVDLMKQVCRGLAVAHSSPPPPNNSPRQQTAEHPSRL